MTVGYKWFRLFPIGPLQWDVPAINHHLLGRTTSVCAYVASLEQTRKRPPDTLIGVRLQVMGTAGLFPFVTFGRWKPVWCLGFLQRNLKCVLQTSWLPFRTNLEAPLSMRFLLGLKAVSPRNPSTCSSFWPVGFPWSHIYFRCRQLEALALAGARNLGKWPQGVGHTGFLRPNQNQVRCLEILASKPTTSIHQFL